MTMFGRPFHFSFFGSRSLEAEGPSAESARDDLVNLMKAKLLNHSLYNRGKFLCTEIQAIAVLGALAAVDISARSAKASDLVAKHMRLLAGISNDRERAYTIEPIDPVLAMAARELFMEGTVKWSFVLDAMASEMRSTTMTGYRGELAGQILFLMAWQQLLKKKCDGGQLDWAYGDTNQVVHDHLDDKKKNCKNEVRAIKAGDGDMKEDDEGVLQDGDGEGHNPKKAGESVVEGTDFEPEGAPKKVVEGDASKMGVRQEDFKAVPVMEYLDQIFGKRVASLQQRIRDFQPELSPEYLAFLIRLVEAGVRPTELKRVAEMVKSGTPGTSELLVKVITALPQLNKIRNDQKERKMFEATADGKKIHEFLSNLEKTEVKAIEALSRVSVTAAELEVLSSMYSETFAPGNQTYLFKYLSARITLRNWDDMKVELNGGYVRVNQFAKTFRKVSSTMLVEAFLRGVAVYCMENQPVIDLCIPVFFPGAEKTGLVSPSNLSAVVIQIKLQEQFESETFKLNWVEDVLDLPFFADASPAKPFVSIFCEFGEVNAVGDPRQQELNVRAITQRYFDSSNKREADGKIVRRTQAEVNTSTQARGYAVFVRGLSVCDLSIWVADPEESVLKAFRRLLAASTDPAESDDVNPEVHGHIKKMFESITYHCSSPPKKKKT